MKSNEEIVKALEACASYIACELETCPYYNEEDDEDACYERLLKDAAYVIRELTVPRKLKIGEISSYITPVWLRVEPNDEGEGEWSGWAEFENTDDDLMWLKCIDGSIMCGERAHYGETWICFSLRPEAEETAEG